MRLFCFAGCHVPLLKPRTDRGALRTLNPARNLETTWTTTRTKRANNPPRKDGMSSKKRGERPSAALATEPNLNIET